MTGWVQILVIVILGILVNNYISHYESERHHESRSLFVALDMKRDGAYVVNIVDSGLEAVPDHPTVFRLGLLTINNSAIWPIDSRTAHDGTPYQPIEDEMLRLGYHMRSMSAVTPFWGPDNGYTKRSVTTCWIKE
jgi:hypothetical protein